MSAGVFGDAWRRSPPAPCPLQCGPAQSSLRSGHPWKTSSVWLGKQRGEETRHQIKSRGLTFYPCAPVPWVHPGLPPCDPPGGPGLTLALGVSGWGEQRGLLPPQPLFGFIWGSQGIMRAELGNGLSSKELSSAPGSPPGSASVQRDPAWTRVDRVALGDLQFLVPQRWLRGAKHRSAPSCARLDPQGAPRQCFPCPPHHVPSLVRGRRAHVRSDNLLRGSGASLWGLTAAPRSQRSNTPIVRGWVLGGGTEAGDTGPPAPHTSLSTPPGPRQGALGGGDLLLALGLCRS